MFIEKLEKEKKENQVRNIMVNNIITLRKIHKIEKSITKIKDSNILTFSSNEKNYLISSLSLSNLPNSFNEYWYNQKQKDIALFKCLNDEKEITLKYSIDKNNLIKFVLFQYHQIINNDLINNNKENLDFIKNIFNINTINKLILLLFEYTNEKNMKIKDNEIIIFNICKILIKLTAISADFSFLIIQNDINLQLIFSSLKYFQRKNQFISNNLLILIYNLYIDDENSILNKCDKLIPLILENLYNYQLDPIENIIQIDFLFNLMEFLSLLLNERTFHIYLNNQYINECINLAINIYQNYENDCIKLSSLKCLSCLLHCVDENANLKIKNLVSFIKSLLNNLNIEVNSPFIVVKTLEIISFISYLFEAEEFSSDELINEINLILISLVFHKGQIQGYYDKIKLNSIIENISIVLLNFCLSIKVCEYIIQNTSIIKNVILILYNYSLDLEITKNLYNLLNEFLDNIDNFMFLILCNFLEIGIIKSLDKYIYNKNYEIILIILNLAYKALEFGNINNNQNIENNSKLNFVHSFLDKKGFNDKLNLIISPDFGDMKCLFAAKRIQEEFFN